jgi:hypothetical protein
MDAALLVTYGCAGIWVWSQSRPEVNASLTIGARVGLLLGTVLIANHGIELFVAVRPFVVVISPVLLALVLFGAAGSAVWERTRSLLLGVAGGVWCAIVGMLILISFVLCFNLVFETRAVLTLREAFAASGMNEPSAFLVKNTLEAASEGLVRMPIFAAVLSLTGAVMNAWISGRSRRMALIVGCVAPLMFAAGVAALWHADSLERAARPPFVMSGVLLAGVALCGVHPVWSALRRTERGMSGGAL